MNTKLQKKKTEATPLDWQWMKSIGFRLSHNGDPVIDTPKGNPRIYCKWTDYRKVEFTASYGGSVLPVTFSTREEVLRLLETFGIKYV